MNNKTEWSTQDEDILTFIKNKKAEGHIIYDTIAGLYGGPVKDFIKQPAEGILYDLNRDTITTETLAKAGQLGVRWINDYAVATTVEALKNRIEELEKELGRLIYERF